MHYKMKIENVLLEFGKFDKQSIFEKNCFDIDHCMCCTYFIYNRFTRKHHKLGTQFQSRPDANPTNDNPGDKLIIHLRDPFQDAQENVLHHCQGEQDQGEGVVQEAFEDYVTCAKPRG